MKKFLLGSIVLMLIFYAMAVPFVDYYSTVENPGEAQMEHALVMEMQMTNCFAMAVILFAFLAAVLFSGRYKPNR